MDEQVETVENVLKIIDAGKVPVVMVFNKTDRCYSRTIMLSYRKRYKEAVAISALTGQGVEDLKTLIRSHIDRRSTQVQVRFPVTDGALDAFVRSRTRVIEEGYDDQDMVLTIAVDPRLLAELLANPHLRVERM
jgi:GTP-binding protein HflX